MRSSFYFLKKAIWNCHLQFLSFFQLYTQWKECFWFEDNGLFYGEYSWRVDLNFCAKRILQAVVVAQELSFPSRKPCILDYSIIRIEHRLASGKKMKSKWKAELQEKPCFQNYILKQKCAWGNSILTSKYANWNPLYLLDWKNICHFFLVYELEHLLAKKCFNY